jgi:hypothetical protein
MIKFKAIVPIASAPPSSEQKASADAIEDYFPEYYQQFIGEGSVTPTVWRSPERFQSRSKSPAQRLKLVLSLVLLSVLGLLLIQLGRYLAAQSVPSTGDAAKSTGTIQSERDL